MTQLLIDVVDISGGTHPDDKVRLWAPQHRPGGEQVVSTSPVDVPLIGGQATVDVLPGPARVQIMTRGVVDSSPKRVTIPDEASVTLSAVIETGFEWEPEVVSRVAALVSQAEQVAEDAATTAIEQVLATASLYTGTGFPEGKVSAPVGSIYTDTAATAGAVRWIKTSGTGNTGWQVEYGDTGWRNLTGMFSPAPTGGIFSARRTPSTVDFHLDFFNIPTGTETTVTLTRGFLPIPTTQLPVYRDGVQVGTLNTSGSSYTLAYRHTGSYAAAYILSIPIRYSRGWPTTLPGVPA